MSFLMIIVIKYSGKFELLQMIKRLAGRTLAMPDTKACFTSKIQFLKTFFILAFQASDLVEQQAYW
jgi:hypothetical protein